MKSVLIELHYLPCIAYFSAISDFDQLFVEKYEHYQKQSYRNRCYVNTAQGRHGLIVPLVHGQGKTNVSDIKLDYSQQWLNNHWRTIRSAYGKAPFFEYYQEDLHKVLFAKHKFLFDLNFALLTLCLKWLKYNTSVRQTSSYQQAYDNTITDYRAVINPKKADSCNRFYQTVEYQQVFGSMFVENLSIIDLIFCEGPRALSIVKASALK